MRRSGLFNVRQEFSFWCRIRTLSPQTYRTMRTHEGIKKRASRPHKSIFIGFSHVVSVLVPCCSLVGFLLFPCWVLVVPLLISCCSLVGKMLFSCWSFLKNSISLKWQDTHLYYKRILQRLPALDLVILAERRHASRIRWAHSCKWICFYSRPGLYP